MARGLKYSRLARADHVGHGLLADLQRCSERAHEEHGEGVEDGCELHLDFSLKGSAVRRLKGWLDVSQRPSQTAEAAAQSSGEQEKAKAALLERI